MDNLKVAGISLVLVDTVDGPALGKQQPELESLAWVVNSAATGGFPALVKSLERGEDAANQALYAVRPEPDNDVTQQRNRWRNLTGSDPGEDTYLVGTSFTNSSILVPRKALQEIILALQNLRQQGFIVPPESQDDHTTVLASNDSTKNAQLPPTIPDTQVDEIFLRELEERAVALDALDKSEQSLEIAAACLVKRRFLLVELADFGLFDPSVAKEQRLQLEQLQLPTLLAYHTAAMELLSYLASPERKRFFPDSKSYAVLGASISIDWFRLHAPIPKEYQPYDWLAFCESILCKGDNGAASSGEIFSHIGKNWYRLYWRKDDGVTPALVSAKQFNTTS